MTSVTRAAEPRAASPLHRGLDPSWLSRSITTLGRNGLGEPSSHSSQGHGHYRGNCNKGSATAQKHFSPSWKAQRWIGGVELVEVNCSIAVILHEFSCSWQQKAGKALFVHSQLCKHFCSGSGQEAGQEREINSSDELSRLRCLK